MNLENETPDDSGDALALLDDMDTDAPVGDDESIADDAPREDLEDGQADNEEPDGDESENDDDQSEAEVSADKAVKPKSRAQKRIDKLTREKNDARREADYALRQTEETNRKYDDLLRQVQQHQATPEQLAQGQRQGLSPEQTQTLIRREATQQVEAERFNHTVTTIKQRLETDGAGDALARLSNPKLTNFENEAVTALTEAKYPAKIAKAIAGNEEVFERFSSLKSGAERARFIARLDGRLEGRAASSVKSDVKPTPRVRGSARKPEKSVDDMTQAEYEAHAEKQGWL